MSNIHKLLIFSVDFDEFDKGTYRIIKTEIKI